jgi:hypothetical protein
MAKPTGPYVQTEADERYWDLLLQVQAVVGHDLANELDETVGRRLPEAEDRILDRESVDRRLGMIEAHVDEIVARLKSLWK